MEAETFELEHKTSGIDSLSRSADSANSKVEKGVTNTVSFVAKKFGGNWERNGKLRNVASRKERKEECF